jgi:mono/diheme cytochrome c family protein
LDVLLALALIGLALFVGALLFRRAPAGLLIFGAIVVAFGVGIPALVIDDNKSDEGGGGASAAAPSEEASGGDQQGEEASAEAGAGGESGGGGAGGGSAQAEGKQIFTQSCGTCHTLADAGTNGTVGPNLDELKPNKQRVVTAIENGGAGTGAMPANIVTGQEAEAVAEYVSTVAGK